MSNPKRLCKSDSIVYQYSTTSNPYVPEPQLHRENIMLHASPNVTADDIISEVNSWERRLHSGQTLGRPDMIGLSTITVDCHDFYVSMTLAGVQKIVQMGAEHRKKTAGSPLSGYLQDHLLREDSLRALAEELVRLRDGTTL